LSSDPIQAAEKLALSVWDFLSEHRVAGSVTHEARDAIRTAAFRFSREVQSSDIWQVTYARRLAAAAAVLVWADAGTEESFKAIERASRRYEEFRLAPPTK
jgi:hypothetical protein